jgi:hypothetical protein
MTITRATALRPGIQPSSRRASANAGLVVAAALFLAVLIVEAAIIVTGAPSATDLSSFYLFTT